MSVAAKTGTTNSDYDRWLCGFTPYYTATVWYGYDTNATVSRMEYKSCCYYLERCNEKSTYRINNETI